MARDDAWRIDRLIRYLEDLPKDTEIVQWDIQNDLQMPQTVGSRVSIQLTLFAPSNIIRGEVSRPELEARND